MYNLLYVIIPYFIWFAVDSYLDCDYILFTMDIDAL